MMKRIGILICGLCAVAALCAAPARAQWTTQTFQFEEGWTAIYLEVAPVPAQAFVHFDEKPIEAVWTFNDRFDPDQALTDPELPDYESEDWIFFAPASSPHVDASNLFALEEGRAYLVKSATDWEWTVKGRLRFRDVPWNPDRLNLRGFHVDPNNEPTFATYLDPSPALKNTEIYRLVNGPEEASWEAVNMTDTINSGEAYWVFSNGPSDYAGPVKIDLSEGTRLDYALSLVDHSVLFQNRRSAGANVTVRPIGSLEPPNFPTLNLPDLAGSVPLEYRDSNSGVGLKGGGVRRGYVDIEPTAPATISFENGETQPKTVRLAVRRPDMEAYDGNGPALYQSLLEVTDGLGFRRLVGVVSQSADRAVAKGRGAKQLGGVDSRAGLWVGNVVMKRVSQPRVAPEVTTPTSAEFSYRIMIHVDAGGQARLVNRVTQMWREGTTLREDGSQYNEIETTGEFVLVTPSHPELLETLQPDSILDEREFARRISTAAYSLKDDEGNPFDLELDSTGQFGAEGTVVSGEFAKGPTHPTNPFRHQYHPLHGLGYEIQRSIALTFSGDSPEDLNLPGWQDTIVGGGFLETIRIVRPELVNGSQGDQVVVVEGVFQLQRASTVAELNEGAL